MLKVCPKSERHKILSKILSMFIIKVRPAAPAYVVHGYMVFSVKWSIVVGPNQHQAIQCIHYTRLKLGYMVSPLIWSMFGGQNYGPYNRAAQYSFTITNSYLIIQTSKKNCRGHARCLMDCFFSLLELLIEVCRSAEFSRWRDLSVSTAQDKCGAVWAD